VYRGLSIGRHLDLLDQGDQPPALLLGVLRTHRRHHGIVHELLERLLPGCLRGLLGHLRQRLAAKTLLQKLA
jgi:hypothetical protein